MRVTRLPLKPMHIALIIASLLYLIAATASGAPGASRGAMDLLWSRAAVAATSMGPSAGP